ncbi:hypothetical protein [Nocardia sp. bgisy134]|uniref:hypothetical protein n=1 Tax=unclassified Nocardia TaxID=2637762 RepID=UPI003D741F21
MRRHTTNTERAVWALSIDLAARAHAVSGAVADGISRPIWAADRDAPVIFFTTRR